MKDYTGKVCGITGAACGIGKAFALYAAEKGMRLALIDIDDRVEDVRKECEAAGSPKAIAIKVDVSEYEQVRMSVNKMQIYGIDLAKEKFDVSFFDLMHFHNNF